VVYLIVSQAGRLTLKLELGLSLDDPKDYCLELLDPQSMKACVSSGSFFTEGMVVALSSMTTLRMTSQGLSVRATAV